MKNRIVLRVVQKDKLLSEFLRYYMENLYKNTNFYDKFAYGSCQTCINLKTLKKELRPILQYCQVFIMTDESQVLKDDVLIYRVGSTGKVDWTNFRK